jgi:hypothetical protein
VPHRVLAIDRVVISASDALDLHVAGIDELGEDPLGRALGDPNVLGDLAQADIGRLRDAEEDLSVVGEERPGRWLINA